MAAYKSLLKNVEWKPAGKSRKCYHGCARKRIPKGDPCLVVKEGMETKGYCIDCGTKMIEKAQEALAELAQTGGK